MASPPGKKRITHVEDLTASPFDRAKAFLDTVNADGYNYHDKTAAQSLTLLSATVSPTNPQTATTIFTLHCVPSLCNSTGNLHGGAVALIFDICTSMTIGPVAKEGFWNTGHVSRTLNCTYLRPVKAGSVCRVESEIVHLGRRVGFLRGRIFDEGGRIAYTCEHGKVAVGVGESKM